MCSSMLADACLRHLSSAILPFAPRIMTPSAIVFFWTGEHKQKKEKEEGGNSIRALFPFFPAGAG